MTRNENGRKVGTEKGNRHKAGDKLKKLSKKEERFVAEYTTHFNATRAAISSGICAVTTSRASAAVTGCNLLKKNNVKQAVEKAVQAIIDDKKDLQARVIAELKALAFSDIKDVVDYDGNELTVRGFDDIDTRAVQSIERQPIATNSQGVIDHVIKVRLHEKKGALDTLSKYLGMMKDQAPSTEIHIHIDERDARLV
jgi:phage terminase small subunit